MGLNRTPIRNPVGHKWHGLAEKVMQFLSEGRYVANVVYGKVTLYEKDSPLPQSGPTWYYSTAIFVPC